MYENHYAVVPDAIFLYDEYFHINVGMQSIFVSNYTLGYSYS